MTQTAETTQNPGSGTPSGDLPAKFLPADHEPRIRTRWDESGAFHAGPARVLSEGKRRFSMVIPPPNVTARLHLGHALNNTLQDILARVHRMKGYETLWMPGTDHAGIATQTVVEQRILKEEGKRRTDFERDAFIARVQAWKDEYEAAISDQLRQMGCSCDWDRQRFTMDEICARAVREAFFRLFKAGLIYRGKRLVNWDPVTQTALADDEVEMEEIEGKFYYLRYPLVDGAQPVTWSQLAARGYPDAGAHPSDEAAWVTVATTRPETYLGDSGVAINPKDARAAALGGLHVCLPLVGRVIPIVEDEYVVMPDPESSDSKAKFATGFLKVTPAHDPNDWEIGQRHQLNVINVMAPDASISDQHGWEDVGDARLFIGLSREEARGKVVAEFQARGLLEDAKPYTHSVGHSYRSHAAIEPYLSDQWYCKVTDERLRGFAQRAVVPEQRTSDTSPARAGVEGDGAMRFFPARYAQMYESWHDNLRDWCISRQLWWGHRIPVWRGTGDLLRSGDLKLLSAVTDRLMAWVEQGELSIQYKGEAADIERPDLEEADELSPFFLCVRDPNGTGREIVEYLESNGAKRDDDVLDTWFSSALWPISTMGWPEPGQSDETRNVLEAFNPTSVLSTAREIITLWVSRMAMFNRFFRSEDAGETPGPIPFEHVYIHPVVQDGHGQRMSKSLGNGVDPLDIIHSHGADAMRFVLCQMTTTTQDVRLPVDVVCPHCGHTFEAKTMVAPDSGRTVAEPVQTCPSCSKEMVSTYGLNKGHSATDDQPASRNSSSKFDAGRNFGTKLWNAARFTMMNLTWAIEEGDTTLEPGDVDPRSLSLIDRWMLSRLARAIESIDTSLAEYRFSEYAQTMYELVWWDFCDWYLEAVKPTVKTSPTQQAVLRCSLETILRLLHPITPFVTEVLHERVRAFRAHAGGPGASVSGLDLDDCDLLCSAGWPSAEQTLVDAEAESRFEQLRSIVSAIREARTASNVHPRQQITLHADAPLTELIATGEGIVETLAGLERITTEPAPDGSITLLIGASEHALSGLADAVDTEAEKTRLAEQIAKLTKDVENLEKRLNNPGYVNKAPAHLVDETRGQLSQKQSELQAASAKLGALG